VIHRDAERLVRDRAVSPSAKAPPPAVPSSTIRVALVSDSALFRSGLRRLVAADRSLLIVGEAPGPPVRDLVRRSSPQILLVDAQMDGALGVCAELRQTRPWVILAGANGDERWAVQALTSGARGILAKSAPVENLLKAIRVIHQGQVWASNRVIALTIEELAAGAVAVAARVAESLIQDRLSPREQQVVQLIVRGFSNLEIASRLGITEATVKAHLTHIFQKLALRGRGQLVARYHQSLSPAGREAGAASG
jgi:DNA-binding NarL/FixJ family response regulator